MNFLKSHQNSMQTNALLTLIALTLFAYEVSCQDQTTTSPTNVANQFCISECGTCPTICSSSPPSVTTKPPPQSPPPTTPSQTPTLTPLPLSPPQKPPPASTPPTPIIIQPLLPPSPLPPLLPLQSPPGQYSAPPGQYITPPAHQKDHPPPIPPLTPSSGPPPKSSGSSDKSPSPPVSFPYVINPVGPAPPYPYYYFYEASDSSLVSSKAYVFIVVYILVHVLCFT